MNRPTLIDLDPVEINYYRLIVSLDKSTGICNAVDEVSIKRCVPQ